MKIIKVLFIVLGVFFGISVSAWAADLIVNVAGPSGGDDTALVQAALDQGIAVDLLREGRLTIGGLPSAGNLVKNCEIGLLAIDLDDSAVDFSHNDVSVVGPSASGGICVFQGAYSTLETPTSFLIQHNRFKASGSYEDGVSIVDYGPLSGVGKKGDFVISQNTITIEPSANGPAYAGIQTDFTVGTVISNNRIVGSGLFRISIEGDTQCMVKGNNVNGVMAEVAPIGLMTNGWFYPDSFPTTNPTVVGFGNKMNVYDEGVNNTLVGVNNMNGNPPGPAIRDAMKRKMETIKSVRRP